MEICDWPSYCIEYLEKLSLMHLDRAMKIDEHIPGWLLLQRASIIYFN